MPTGAIVDLDREPEAPADLFVNGRHFGTGSVMLVDGEWASGSRRSSPWTQKSNRRPAAVQSPQASAE